MQTLALFLYVLLSMRYCVASFFLLILVHSFWGCSSQDKKLRGVAQHYLDATSRYDVPDACRYCTEETADGLRMLDTTIMRIVDSDYIKRNMPAKVKINGVDMVNDSMAVVSYHKHTPISDFDGELNMVQRNGRWMANVKINIPSFMKQSHVEYKYDSVPKLMKGEGDDSIAQ